MRETAETKSRRLLVSGAVRITHVGRWYVAATVAGDSAIYQTGYESGRWFCSCPCLTGCSHVLALRLVADPVPAVRAVAS
jgi:hypothetical protein